MKSWSMHVYDLAQTVCFCPFAFLEWLWRAVPASENAEQRAVFFPRYICMSPSSMLREEGAKEILLCCLMGFCFF